MDLVKARQRARKKAREKKKEGLMEEEITSAGDDSSLASSDIEGTDAPVLPETYETNAQETLVEKKSPSVVDPLDTMVTDEVFHDDSFGEDLPVMDIEESDDGGHILSTEGQTPAPGLELNDEKTPANMDATRNEDIIMDFDADEENMSDAMIGGKLDAITRPESDAGKHKDDWSVQESGVDKPAPFKKLDLARVEVEWEENQETGFQIDKLGIHDDDFYALVSEDLYMREFGHESDEALGPQIELLSFRLANEIYAVRLSNISQIIKMGLVTMVPRSPDFVLGIMSLRGMVIPVFDLRRKLNLPKAEKTRKTRIIVVNSGIYTAGLIVDEVEQVVRFSETGIEPPPSLLGSIESDYIEGIGRIDKKLIIMLELTKILTPVKGD